MTCLVIAEHDNDTLLPATLRTVTAATCLAEDIHVLVAGHRCAGVAKEAARITGVSKVLMAEADYLEIPLAENMACLVASVTREGGGGRGAGYDNVLAPATTTGKNFMPRVAAMLDVAQISDIVAVESADTFVRPIYAGNILATVRSMDCVKVITVRTSAFEAAGMDGSAGVEVIEATPDYGRSRVVSREFFRSERPDLAVAMVVVSGGRGLGSGENYHKLLEPLADQLCAALGATRAAVDAGYVPNDCQIGQTGKIVAPQLYIAVGLSGAIQHLAGMKSSRIVVAINRDAEAPIFKVADYGLVGDLFEIVPALSAELAKA